MKQQFRWGKIPFDSTTKHVTCFTISREFCSFSWNNQFYWVDRSSYRSFLLDMIIVMSFLLPAYLVPYFRYSWYCFPFNRTTFRNTGWSNYYDYWSTVFTFYKLGRKLIAYEEKISWLIVLLLLIIGMILSLTVGTIPLTISELLQVFHRTATTAQQLIVLILDFLEC